MPTFNGHLASLTLDGSTASQVFGTTATQTVTVDAAVPHKFMKKAVFAVRAIDGVSGGFSVDIYGSVGGATFLIAGVSAITGVGNTVIGNTGQDWGEPEWGGVPRPGTVVFASNGTITGFTASVYMAGEY